jgi:predicted ferric reductase
MQTTSLKPPAKPRASLDAQRTPTTITPDDANTILPAVLPPLIGVLIGLVIIVVVGLILGGQAGGFAALGEALTGSQSAWLLSRASAFVAYLLLWLSMVLGLALTNRLARIWPGGPTAGDLHEYASLLAVVFTLLHGLVLLGDTYIGYTLPQILIPFSSAVYLPLWVGLGQIGLYALALVTFSFYVRRRIGARTWRAIHT